MSAILSHLLARARAGQKPFSLTLELNRYCNLRCRHCYHGQFDGHELSLQQLKWLLPQCARLGTLSLTMTGGEVLAHPDFMAMVRAARAQRFQVNLISNLTLLTPELARELKEAGIGLVRTSLYFADSREHDAFVGQEGAFAATLQGLDLLADLGVPTKVQVVLMEKNLPQLAALERLAQVHRALFSGVFFMDPLTDGRDTPLALAPTLASLKAVVATGQHSSLLEPWMARRECDAEGCGAGLFSAFIDADFQLWPCMNWPWPVGQLAADNFSTLWHGEKMAQARQLLQQATKCRHCQNRQYCSPCIGLNLRQNGSVDLPYWGRCSEAAGYAAVFAGMAHESYATEKANKTK